MNQQICTCPKCCPEKWELNRMANKKLYSSEMSQTGMASDSAQAMAMSNVLARLERIEKILTDHNSTKVYATTEHTKDVYKAAFDLIQKDPHQWSSRPCNTCRAVSTIIGRSFGCYLFVTTPKE